MFQLKDIANAFDCHPRTAKKWIRKLDTEQRKSGNATVAADVTGHGPHRWEEMTFNRLVQLYKNFMSAKGITPQIWRAKFTGDLVDARQMEFNLIAPPAFIVPQYKDSDALPTKTTHAKKTLKTNRKEIARQTVRASVRKNRRQRVHRARGRVAKSKSTNQRAKHKSRAK